MRTSAALCVLFLLAGCSRHSPSAPSDVPPSDLRTSPTSVVLGGRTLTLDTSLWRDFMPIAPPDGRPLIAVLRIKTDNGSVVASTVRADAMWVLHDNEVWSAVPQEERPRAETSPVYELVARDGPKWGPGVNVDVVVRLRDEAGGISRLLRASDQLIVGAF